MREIRLIVRRLWNAPAFAITAMATVALAIGVNSMIFSAVRGLLVHPLPFPDAERLVWIYGRNESADAARDKPTELEVNAVAKEATGVAAVAVLGDRAFVRAEGARRVRWSGIWVTPSLFTVLGVGPSLGRAFDASDTQGGAPVMMLGYDRWQRDFGGDPAIVGRVVHFIDNHQFTVVGILPRGLEFPFGPMPQSGNGSGFTIGEQDFWIVGQEGDGLPGGAALARVKPTATVARVQTEAATIGARLAAAQPATQANRSLELVSLRDQALGLVRPGLRLAQGFAILMLLLACANLTNLMVLRTTARDRELGVRAALGASHRAIAWSVVAEVVVLSVGGGAGGLAVATLAPTGLEVVAAGSIPMLEHVTVDWTVAAFTLGATGFVAAIVAVIPAALVIRGNLHRTLLSGGRTHTTDRRRAQLAAHGEMDVQGPLPDRRTSRGSGCCTASVRGIRRVRLLLGNANAHHPRPCLHRGRIHGA